MNVIDRCGCSPTVMICISHALSAWVGPEYIKYAVCSAVGPFHSCGIHIL